MPQSYSPEDLFQKSFVDPLVPMGVNGWEGSGQDVLGMLRQKMQVSMSDAQAQEAGESLQKLAMAMHAEMMEEKQLIEDGRMSLQFDGRLHERYLGRALLKLCPLFPFC
jgi:hypothetical protein